MINSYTRFSQSELTVSFRLIVCAVVLASLFGGRAIAEQSEHVGKWIVACDERTKPSTKTCDISQSVVDRNVNLSATVALSFDTISNTYLKIIVPRSIELTRGIVVAADGEQFLNLRIRKCNNVGCIAEHKLSPNELISMSDRSKAEILLHVSEKDGYSLPVDFAHLPAALEHLAKMTGVRYSAYSPADHPPKILRVLFSGVRRTPIGQATRCTSEVTINSNAVLQSDSARVLDAKLEENVKKCEGTSEQVVYIDSTNHRVSDYKPEQAVAEYLYRKGVDTVRLGHDGTYETLVLGQD